MNGSDLSSGLGFSGLAQASSARSLERHSPNREGQDQPHRRPRPSETEEDDFGAEAEDTIVEDSRHQLDDLA